MFYKPTNITGGRHLVWLIMFGAPHNTQKAIDNKILYSIILKPKMMQHVLYYDAMVLQE